MHPKKFVITGGPGCGKTSAVLALEIKGEHVIREAAEDVIRFQQAKGIMEPWRRLDFQRMVLRLQEQREARVPMHAKRLFLDRGIHDGIAYLRKKGQKLTPEFKKEARHAGYEKIFMLDNLGHVEKDKVRRENLKEAMELERLIEAVYREFGCEIIRVPAMPLEKRVRFILRKL